MRTRYCLMIGLALALVFSHFAWGQIIKTPGCSVDLELVKLPSCAIVTKNDHTYISAPFVQPLFQGVNSRLASTLLPDGAWAYLDRSGLVRVTGVAFFDNGASSFHYGLVRIVRNGKYGLANEQGILVSRLYDGMLEFAPDHCGWKACDSCHLKKFGEYSSFEGGNWFLLNRHARARSVTEK